MGNRPGYMHDWRIQNAAMGRCSKCINPRIEGKSLCEKHLAYAREQRRKAWLDGGREVQRDQRERRRLEGKCWFCSEPARNGRVTCERHGAYNREQWHKSHARSARARRMATAVDTPTEEREIKAAESTPKCRCGLRIDKDHTPETCDMPRSAASLADRRKPVEW